MNRIIKGDNMLKNKYFFQLIIKYDKEKKKSK